MKMRPDKNKKAKDFFIIRFPNGAEALIKVRGWNGCTAYVNYVKDEFDTDTILISISRWEAIKFILKGCVFDVGK